MKKKLLRYNLGKQVGVVLGGGIHDDGTAWPASALRAQLAAKLAADNPDMTLIISGDGRKNRPLLSTEAAMMAQLVWLDGIDAKRILIEGDAIDTIGNAVLVAARFLYGQRPRPVHLVTSPFHVRRAGIAFGRVLGPAWPLTVHAAQPAGDDAKRAAEEANVEPTEQFFAPVTPGDLPQIVKRLFAVGKPFYRTLPLLTGLAHKAA